MAARIVRCTNPDCARNGIVVRVRSGVPVAAGIEARAPLHCTTCDSLVTDTIPPRTTAVETAMTAPPENAARVTGRGKAR